MSDSQTSPPHTNSVCESTDSQVRRDAVSDRWSEIFPYETVYPEQVSGIRTGIDTLSENGYFLLEGACGTGKTALALTSCLELLRDDIHTQYDTVTEAQEFQTILAVTPVKQQITQFVTEMREINRHRATPAPTVALRGKPDLAPYIDAETGQLVASLQRESSQETLSDADETKTDSDTTSPQTDGRDQLARFQELTRKLIEFGSDIKLEWPDGASPPDFSLAGYDWDSRSRRAEIVRNRNAYDPNRAAAVVKQVQSLCDQSDTDKFSVDGVPSPYPDRLVNTTEVVAEDSLPDRLIGPIDPFFAGAYAENEGIGYGFAATEHSVFDRDALVETGVSRGISPYQAMLTFAESADVIIGNYMHLFDPQTKRMLDQTLDILTEETLVIVDEAHRIETRVRDMLSDSIRLRTLKQALIDLQQMRLLLTDESKAQDTLGLSPREITKARDIVRHVFAEQAQASLAGASEFEIAEEFVTTVQDTLRELTQEHLSDAESPLPSSEPEAREWDPDDHERPLTIPTDPTDTDCTLVKRVCDKCDCTEDRFVEVGERLHATGLAYTELVEQGYDVRSGDTTAGRILKRWTTEDPAQYHRTIRVHAESRQTVPDDAPAWMLESQPELQLFNCIPREELQRVFESLGGGILMSATLEPVDLLAASTGVRSLEMPSQQPRQDPSRHGIPGPSPATDSDSRPTRPTEHEAYPLRFDPENRLSLVVNLPKFTAQNRGYKSVRIDNMTPVRRQYAEVIDTLVTQQPGNCLIALPNYGEAEWAARWIETLDTDKQVYLDQSTSSQKTTQLLDSFFADDEAVLLTSTLGTVTEGIDYEGDKLHSAAVIGIPLLPVALPRYKAVRAAYEELLDVDGFEAAFKVPAVRKARQAIGRVIRGHGEIGTRFLVDERYGKTGWDGAQDYLSAHEQGEFATITHDGVERILPNFWNQTHISS